MPRNCHAVQRMPVVWASVLLLAACGAAPRPPLESQAYVWQRAWTGGVTRAVALAAPRLSGLTVLAAEVSFERGCARTVVVDYDAHALRDAQRPIGLALRIGPFSGPFAGDDGVARGLASLAAGLVERARAAGIEPAELQLDFDCGDGALAGYRLWIERLRAAIAPVPLVLTVLPSWLARPELVPLVRCAGAFVLQVHSVSPPRGAASFELCDPAAARRAVRVAAGLGVPFRVALPTYGYLAAFDRSGRLLGLTAEGEAPGWRAAAMLREVRSDPAALAGLVREWECERPANLAGVIWFRLPCEGDRRAWRWPTFAAVLGGRVPRAEVRAEVRRRGDGLVELDLVNAGDADARMPVRVGVRSRPGRTAAADGMRGFTVVAASGGGVELVSPTGRWLAAGEQMTIGWLRLTVESEVVVDVGPSSS